MAVITMREALNQALSEEMERDGRVILMGEEVAEYQGELWAFTKIWGEEGSGYTDQRVRFCGLGGGGGDARVATRGGVHDLEFFDGGV